MKLGVTLGDPAGIGPEITAKSLPLFPRDEIYLIGNKENFVKTLKRLGTTLKEAEKTCRLSFIDIPASGLIEHAKVQKSAGEVAIRSIEKCASLAQNGEIESIVTSPINKESIILAGSKFVDHETMLANLTGSKQVSTVFEIGDLRIIFMPPKHVPLKQAVRMVSSERVFETILLADRSLKLLGIKKRRIAVAALNPHSGDGGLLGREEIEELSPAIKKASKSLDVKGPFAADSVFHMASNGEFDIVVSLYHDQGHIAAKMHDFSRTVSLTIGLPFLRTSVDHGTAFDIAGKNLASPESMIEAMRKAKKYGRLYRAKFAGSNL
ncbi:MAG TPA: 4-hydroxythreonine-4-phosphate dehydrogenase PdxA [Nitrososphaerales archaeon]|nr:4-hydroxythreonine-4-phosphate dehydrogenase PdxA [Nitrososphaerales archaeon]